MAGVGVGVGVAVVVLLSAPGLSLWTTVRRREVQRFGERCLEGSHLLLEG